jgi:hypothetical protein
MKLNDIPQYINFAPHRRFPFRVVDLNKILAQLNLHDGSKVPANLDIKTILGVHSLTHFISNDPPSQMDAVL